MFHFFDRTQFHEWDNGLRLYGFFRPGVSTEVQFHVGTGSIHEGKNLGCGLSHFLEHMLFQGCKGYPGNAVADEVNRLGGELNAFTSGDQTCYWMRMPKNHWRDAVKMLSAMLRFPELPDARFQKEKEVILRECEQGMDSVGNRLYHSFLQTLFLQHPLRHPIIGYPDKIAAVTREMALDYHALRYTPGRTFAVIAGDFDFDAAVAVMEEELGSWGRGNLEEIVLPHEPFPAGERYSEILFPDTLSRLMAGGRLPPVGSREFTAMALLFHMLGTGEGSLLNTSLVLEKKAAQSVGICLLPQGEETMGAVILEAKPEKMRKAADLLEKELENAAKGRFSAARMEREKNQQCADALRDCYDLESIAQNLSSAVLYGKTPQAADRWMENMRQLEVEDLRRAAAEFLDSSRLVQVRQQSELRRENRAAAVSPLRVEPGKTGRGEFLFRVPERTLPMAFFKLLLPGGNLFESPGQHGVSALTAMLMTAGCRRWTEKAMLAQLDNCGADFSVSSGANSMILHLSAPRKKFAAAMKTVSEILSAPLFGEVEFQREKSRFLEFLRTRAMSPFSAALDASSGLLYGKHPYACRERGFPEEIAALTREDVVRFYASRFHRKQLIYGFGGDLSAQEAVDFAEQLSENLPFAELPCPMVEPPRFPETLQECRFSLPRTQTVVLRILPGASALDRGARCAIGILREMENGLSSTLFKDVREKHALCYSVGMFSMFGFHPGNIGFYSMTTPEAAEKVMELLEKEIDRLADGKITVQEFEAARRCAAWQYARGNDDPDSLMKTAILDRHYGDDPALSLSREQEISGMKFQDFLEKVSSLFRNPVPGARVIVTPETK